MKKPFFSIGIIFKDEIRCLERCLKSLQPLRDSVPCEVVMADTGSTDGSRAVAERYADILFDFPWIDDFSAARNAVMDRCSGEWYISVDADEWLAEGIEELKEFSRAKYLPEDFAGYYIRNYQAVGSEIQKDNYVDFMATRIARLSTGVRYQGCIHEGWKDPKGGILQVMSLHKTWFYHDGYTYVDENAQEAKRQRNHKLLMRKLEENPNHLQTLMECTDCVKRTDKDAAVEYVTRAMEGVHKKWFAWDRFGGVIFRNAVSVAALYKLPELREWADEAEKLFPESIYTRVDVAYYAFSYYWSDGDYTRARLWCERYLQGVKDYRAKRFESSESMWGVLENIAPLWERKALVLMPEAYLRCGEPEKAYRAFSNIKGNELEDPKQVELCALMLMRLQRTTMLDAASLAASLWEQINQASPDEDTAKMRHKAFLDTAATSFGAAYHREEQERDDFLRHGCTVFAKLSDQCELGTAAAVLGEENRAELEKLLSAVQHWAEFPIYALEHALQAGAHFPLPEKPLKMEEMDSLAARMSHPDGPLAELAIAAASGDLSNWQSLAWARGLALAAVKSCDWTDKEQGMELCRMFVKIEGKFVPRYYAAELLCDENIQVLPPLHRFGWTCTRAFDALDSGDSAGYIRLLRQGLETCPEMKGMVQFLLKRLEENRRAQATPELLQLADQVRVLLAQYPADDPAVAALKQSTAYRSVAHLIEGPELQVYGVLKQ